jgi:LPXTG-site transpeptidase (sortase) family protein
LVTDPQTGLADWDVDSLFRPGRRDLVGHLERTAFPDKPGNVVLTGHNYGYGYSGVFLRLGQLKAGDRVTLVTEAGDSLVYQVALTERVPWRRKTLDELARHLAYLAPVDEERLTLVSCGGNVAPFLERIYVVAKRAR